MSTLYRPLPELIFSTPWFRRLSANGKLIILTLAAGPCMTGCPGLAEGDAYTLVSLTGLGVDDVRAALAEMTAAKMLEVDDDHRLVRLPWLAKMRATASHKTVRGWFSVWRELPECPLRAAHVAALREACDFGGEGMASAWVETFGKSIASPSDGHDKPLPSPTDHADADADADADAYADATHTQKNNLVAPDGAVPALELLPAGTFDNRRALASMRKPIPPPFDFEAIYSRYPRKGDGKSKGITRLKAQVKTAEAFAQLESAVHHFVVKTQVEQTEPRFIPHFSTWTSRWRDYVDGPHIVAASAGKNANGARAQKLSEHTHSGEEDLS